MRASCFAQSVASTTRAVTYSYDRPYLLHLLARAQDAVNCVQHYQALLSTGESQFASRRSYDASTPAAENGIGTSSLTSLLATAQFVNACPLLVSLSGGQLNQVECNTWSGGAAAKGLTFLVREFVRRSQAVLDRRLRVRIVSDTLTGFELDQATYEYSSNESLATLGTDVLPVVSARGDFPMGWTPGGAAVPWSMAEEYASADLVWLRQADRQYVTPLLVGIAGLYGAATATQRRSAASVINVSSAVTLVLFLLYMAFGYFPRIRSLHLQRRRMRMTLLFLPPQLLARKSPSADVSAVVDRLLRTERKGEGARGPVDSDYQQSPHSSPALRPMTVDRVPVFQLAAGDAGPSGP